MPEDDQYDHNM